MPKSAKTGLNVGSVKRGRPATTPQGRENQIISAAYDLAEQRILNGTASSQEIVHFLRMGSEKEKLERAKLVEENKLLKARTKAMEASTNIEQLLKDGLMALSGYRVKEDDGEIVEDE